MMKTEIDLSTKCRACFSEEQEMHYLFAEFDQGMSLSDILKSTSPFEIEENDELSPYLCENCTTVVVDFFNFKTVYQENENYIRSLLREENQKNLIHINAVTVNDEIKSEDSELKKLANEKSVSNCIDIQNTDIEVKCEKNCNNRNTDLTEISKILENYSQDIDEKNELEVTGGFVEPHDIVEQTMSCKDENLDEYNAENIKIMNSVKYLCGECGEYFLIKSEFQQHVLEQHKMSLCELDRHILKATKKNANASMLEIKDENIRLQCNICKEEFMTYSEIESHYKIHKKYVCEHCGAAFMKKSYLDDHFEVHTTEKRHICPICKKAFRRRTVLVKHKKIHTHPRQCVCEVCGLRFNDRGTLKTHIKLKHTKVRDFHCKLCGLWFPLKSTLEKHIFRHNENRERPFECSICNMAYRDKSSLNRHIIVKHTDDAKRPSCIYCGKQYTTNTNLLKHIRKHHSSPNIKHDPDSD